MRCLLALALSLGLGLCEGLADGPPAPGLSMPSEVSVKCGRPACVTIKATGPAKAIMYEVHGTAGGVEPIREYHPDASTVRLKLLTFDPGVYYIVASTAAGDVPAQATCKLVVRPATPTPPGPNPGPEPGPAPSDPVVQRLQQAINADLAAGKGTRAMVSNVEALLREAPGFLDSLASVGELQTTLQKAIQSRQIVTPGALPATGAALFAYLASALPGDGNTPLNATNRASIALLLAQVADKLKGANQ